MTHKQKRIFFNWLQKHDALEKYRHNRHIFIKLYYKRGLRWIISNYSSMDIAEALGVAFSWGDTPEGGQYWRNLDAKWIHEYRNIIE